MKLHFSTFSIFVFAITLGTADDQVVFRDDFSQKTESWKPTDTKSWRRTNIDGNFVYELVGASNYKPKFRSPLSISWIDDQVFGSFTLTARVQTTQSSRGHRDLCFFFGGQNESKFYYIHLGEKADPHSSQVFIVNDAPRVAISEHQSGIDWKDGKWHQIKLIRDIDSGKIELYFDDMKKPVKVASDKTFGEGKIGIGSFDDSGYFDDIVIRSTVE